MAKYEAEYTYTDSELLALYREAMARISVSGQSYEIGDRVFTAADLPAVRQQIEWLESRVNSASGSVDNLVNFRRR